MEKVYNKMLTVTATDLPRLMTCNGSRLMGGFIPPVDKDDTVRNEGNAAHWLVEQVHTGKVKAKDLIDQKASNGVYITADIVDHLEDYLKAVKTFKAGTLIEYNTSFSGGPYLGENETRQGWKVNGRADLLDYDPKTCHLDVADLKYGWGIVEPEDNWTLIAHLIGFITLNPDKPVMTATLTIYQPRPHHSKGTVRPWSINQTQITALYQQILKTLDNPDDNLNTSKHCTYCPALVPCPAARNAKMNAIDASEKVFIEEIDNKNLSFQLDHLKRSMEVLKTTYTAYSELALFRVRKGQIVDNYGLETELTNSNWLPHVNADMLKALTGKDLTKTQLITPTQAKKKGVSKEFVKTLTERRDKGIKLVRVDADTKAKKLFNKPKEK